MAPLAHWLNWFFLVRLARTAFYGFSMCSVVIRIGHCAHKSQHQLGGQLGRAHANGQLSMQYKFSEMVEILIATRVALIEWGINW